MKRYFSVILLVILALTLSAALFSCGDTGERVPDGTYSGVAADFGEVYTFKGKKVRVVAYLFGEIAEQHDGAYTLTGDSITFRFPTDEDGIYSRTLTYAISEDGDSITIDGDVFRRVTVGETTADAGGNTEG